MRDDFLRGASAVLDAPSDPAVATAWDEPSVLAGQTVGGLVGHLARSVSGLAPAVPEDLVALVAGLGTAVAIERHGPTAVLRHLFRTGVAGPPVVPVL